MGQTLDHGVYLPAEGERNCYSGLASNWNLLDTAIGDTAGKASATHTHGNITNDGKIGTTANLPLITGTGGAIQAGSFGNQANTFCEGNDSRLSDARTPVAHTHTKSDVTDLLNSNFIPSANNSYDLGSSSYQWNNLYAKNYYYNGTEFQNKFVTLDTGQTINYSKTFASSAFLDVHGYRLRVINANMELGVVPASNQWTGMQFVDKNNTAVSEIVQSFQSNGNSIYQINIFPNEANSQKRSVIAYTYNSASNNNALGLSSNLLPTSNNTYNLGSGNQKWKTLNGINPGALSLPSSNYVVIDTTGWDLTGATYNRVYINNANPTFPGILFIRINSTNPSDILVKLFSTSGQEISYVGSKMEADSNHMVITVPCPPSTNIYVSTKTSSTITVCRYYTLLGDPEFDSRSGN